jgi:DNA (cytosine-5)-methyltransferase 1
MRSAASVLFERESVQRDSSPRRAKGQVTSADAQGGAHGSCWWDGGDTAATLTKKNADGAQRMPDKDNFGAVLQKTAGTLGRRGLRSHAELDGHGAYIPVPYRKAKRAQSSTDDESWVEAEQSNTINGWDVGERDTHAVAVAFQQNQPGEVRCSNIAGTVNTNSNASGRNTPMAMQAMTVRRLTPRECERLQGFPDDWTLIPWRGKSADQCPDGPRYKALGNSMAVNCMEWIGERIAREAR